ncbi:MAG TPA: hypothetical protein VJ819_07850 [Nocardioidaceae bacterium]|nr:hypothetical protein [Nocardioidaceae bacterium]
MRILMIGLVAMLVFLGGTAFARSGWAPPDDTITAVSGSRAHGFHLEYHAQRDAWLPTRSEAIAECGEYHRRMRQVRCIVQVRTWYHDLGDMKRALRLARDG